jgi:hypothetical protein
MSRVYVSGVMQTKPVKQSKSSRTSNSARVPSKAISMPSNRGRSCFAMCSGPATCGFAAAICCAGIGLATSISFDRIGDTFRWKGENVSTSEAADVIRACPGVRDTAVYGVAIPGVEGRAGMAAIVADPEFDVAVLQQHVIERLPGYARPVFIRLAARIDTTATFRPKTVELVREGYNPSHIADPIYFNDQSQRRFVRLDPALYNRLCAGELRI